MLSGVVERAGILDLTDDVRDVAVKRLAQALPEHGHSRQGQRIQKTGLHGQDHGHLVGKPKGQVLRLAEDRTNSRTPGQLIANPRVRHSTKPGESLQFEELSVVEAHGLRRLPKRTRLGLAADPADARANVDRRLLPFMEEPGIQHNLTVGD